MARGWRPGFDKVGFTKLLRDHGYRLPDAVAATARLLEDEPVVLQLEGFPDEAAAEHALRALGVREIRPV